MIAGEFVRWLGLPGGLRWLDVGCGTGALTVAVLAGSDPVEVVGIDTAEAFLADARVRVADPRAVFQVGDARELPAADDRFDAVVSGLAVNFVSDTARAVGEFARVAVPGGTVAAYVWDYAEGMAMLRHFWDAATALDPAAAGLDEGCRFPLCAPTPLTRLWSDAGIEDVSVHAIEVRTLFTDFDDYWQPFLGGQGPAPGYVMSLPEDHRNALRNLLLDRLPIAADGSLPLSARAWAIRGTAA